MASKHEYNNSKVAEKECGGFFYSPLKRTDANITVVYLYVATFSRRNSAPSDATASDGTAQVFVGSTARGGHVFVISAGRQ